jgi:cytochrome b561
MKYPIAMRVLHWLMAAIIIGMICVGWTMVSMDDKVPTKFELLYPWHKSFGMLLLMLVIARLVTRLRSSIPPEPGGLARWEKGSAKVAHVALYVLMVAVPCMGYSMSSTYTESDGVFFFGVNLPELLPKNDSWFKVFQALHRILAYTLLAVIAVHVAGALKHRFLDRDKSTDVLPRML